VRKGLLTLAVLAGALALLVAPAAFAKPKGSTVNLMVIGPTNAPGFSLPSMPVGAQIAVNQLNQADGIDGHHVKLLVCDDQNSPNTATACAREAIQDKVVAVVGGLSIFDSKIDPYLSQAHIPWVGSFTPDDYTSPDQFVFGDAGLIGYLTLGQELTQNGCKKVAIILSAQSVPAYTGMITAGVNAGGGTVVGSYTAAATNPNWSSMVAAARAAGAKCIAAGTGPTETGGLVQAIDAGSPLKLALLSGGLPPTLIKQLGSAANGILSESSFYGPNSKRAKLPWLTKQVAKLSPSTPIDVWIESGYASVNVVAQAAEGLKSVTSAAVFKALPKVSNFSSGVGPSVTLTKSVGVKGFPRIFNTNEYVLEVEHGGYVTKGVKPISVLGALKLYASRQ
jgi:branched-chain amino acid transport system substrate-binding protein